MSVALFFFFRSHTFRLLLEDFCALEDTPFVLSMTQLRLQLGFVVLLGDDAQRGMSVRGIEI